MTRRYDPQYYQRNKERILENNKKWRENNRELLLSYAGVWRTEHPDTCHQYTRKTREKAKLSILRHYSGREQPKCAHCGIEDIDVLCLDHILDNGKEERHSLGQGSGYKFYRWLKRNDYPNGYQVLCANCNLKKEIERQRNGNS